ncbi:MAG: oligosaccharide flippase family protein [Nocardioides sp.]
MTTASSGPAPAGGSVRTLMRSGTSIAIAIGVMNVATYGFTMVAARVLGPRDYGALASLMATLLVFGVLQLGLQATAARRISSQPDDVGQIELSIMSVTYRAAVVLGAVLLLATPLLNQLLRLDDLRAAALVGVAAIPMSIMGGQAGILQGERRWWPLAAMYVAAGVPRLVVGTALIFWQPEVFYAMLGVTLGMFAPIALGWLALRHKRVAGSSPGHDARSVLRESFHNSQALLAFFALSNVDVVIARNVLPDHQSGLYAAGLIMTKAVLFLPQFVVVVAFPSLSSPRERRRAMVRGLGIVGVIGVLATLAAWLLSGLAMIFVGGSEYTEIQSQLWLFAALGTLLAMLQLLVYAVLARQGQRSVYAVWLALVLMVAAGLTTSTLTGLLTVVLSVDTVLVALLLAASFSLLRHPAPVEETVSP